MEQTGSAGAGMRRTLERLAGRGPAIAEAQRRLCLRISPKAAGIAGADVMVGGALILYNSLERMEDIRNVLMHRFQNGDFTDEQFREVFGDLQDPDDIQRYWEM